MLETICNKIRKKLRVKGSNVAIGLQVTVEMLTEACERGGHDAAEGFCLRATGYLLCLCQLDVISTQERDTFLEELRDRVRGCGRGE